MPFELLATCKYHKFERCCCDFMLHLSMMHVLQAFFDKLYTSAQTKLNAIYIWYALDIYTQISLRVWNKLRNCMCVLLSNVRTTWKWLFERVRRTVASLEKFYSIIFSSCSPILSLSLSCSLAAYALNNGCLRALRLLPSLL